MTFYKTNLQFGVFFVTRLWLYIIKIYNFVTFFLLDYDFLEHKFYGSVSFLSLGCEFL